MYMFLIKDKTFIPTCARLSILIIPIDLMLFLYNAKKVNVNYVYKNVP